MNAIELLKRDHEKVESLLSQHSFNRVPAARGHAFLFLHSQPHTHLQLRT